MINLLQSGATSGLELQVPLPSEDSRGDVRYGQRAQLSGQPDPVPQLSDCEAAFVSHDLSNRGIDISVFYQSSFQDYNAYQKDKYHKDKNTLVRIWGGGWAAEPQGLVDNNSIGIFVEALHPAPENWSLKIKDTACQ